MECNASIIRTEPGVKASKCKYITVPSKRQSENHLSKAVVGYSNAQVIQTNVQLNMHIPLIIYYYGLKRPYDITV